jgi:hypothetical protein
MVLATLVLLCALPQTANDASKLTDDPAPVVESAKNVDVASAKLPESPASKLETSGAVESSSAKASASGDAAAAPIQPASPASGFQPAAIKPAITGEYRMPHKKVWLGLMAVGHGTAAFDAWSTRRAVSGGYGTESNPLLRGASHSNMIYAATQVSPAVMDFLGRKMMMSRHGWMRKMWWLPQAAGASMSFTAGVHNMSVVP